MAGLIERPNLEIKESIRKGNVYLRYMIADSEGLMKVVPIEKALISGVQSLGLLPRSQLFYGEHCSFVGLTLAPENGRVNLSYLNNWIGVKGENQLEVASNLELMPFPSPIGDLPHHVRIWADKVKERIEEDRMSDFF